MPDRTGHDEPHRSRRPRPAAVPRPELSAQLLREPGGRVDGHRIRYPDGRVFVAVDAGTLSLGQCSEGQFCIWTSTGYTAPSVPTASCRHWELSGWTPDLTGDRLGPDLIQL